MLDSHAHSPIRIPVGNVWLKASFHSSPGESKKATTAVVGDRNCIAARIWKTWKYFHLSWVVFSLSSSHSNACEVILRHFAACYRTLYSSLKRLEQISINFSQLNRFNKFFVSGPVRQSSLARGEHQHSSRLSTSTYVRCWNFYVLAAIATSIFKELWLVTSHETVTSRRILSFELRIILPPPSRRRQKRRPFR